MASRGRPKVRPAVRRLTIELDVPLAERTERQAREANVPLRTVIEEGLAMVLPILEEGHASVVEEIPATKLTDEDRLKNLANAAQDIRTLIETPATSEIEMREWRAHYVLDGVTRVAVLRYLPGEGLAAYVYVRHDFPAARAIAGPDTTPDEAAVFLALDSVPEGHVQWIAPKRSKLLVARQSSITSAPRVQ